MNPSIGKKANTEREVMALLDFNANKKTKHR